MAKDTRQLIPLQEHKLENEPVRQCYLSKLFQFCECRNVWGPDNFPFGRAANPKYTYPGDESFCLDFATAEAGVARRRTKGSKWVIHEVPVLSLCGLFTCLIIGEINSFKPLSGFVPPKRKLLSLRDCARFFQSRSSNSVFQFLCMDSPNPAALPFYKHLSERHGGNQPLTWNKEFAMEELTAMLHVIGHITQDVQQNAYRAFLAAAGL